MWPFLKKKVHLRKGQEIEISLNKIRNCLKKEAQEETTEK